jgi:hypothetical protein
MEVYSCRRAGFLVKPTGNKGENPQAQKVHEFGRQQNTQSCVTLDIGESLILHAVKLRLTITNDCRRSYRSK